MYQNIVHFGSRDTKTSQGVIHSKTTLAQANITARVYMGFATLTVLKAHYNRECINTSYKTMLSSYSQLM